MEENTSQNNFVYKAASIKISEIIRALRIWGILGVVGLLLVIVAFHYLRLIPGSGSIPVLGFIPQHEIPFSIEVDSDNPKYDVVLQKEEELIQLLKSENVFEKFVNDDNGISGEGGIRRIEVILTSQEQPNNLYKDDQGVYSSTSTHVQDNTLRLTIHLADRVLQNPTQDPSDLFTYQFLTFMYRFGRNIMSEQESVSINTEVGKMVVDGKLPYFSIRKK